MLYRITIGEKDNKNTVLVTPEQLIEVFNNAIFPSAIFKVTEQEQQTKKEEPKKEVIKNREPSFQSFVVVKTSFAAFHKWEDAPEYLQNAHIGFLKNLHRHMFHVTVSIKNAPNKDLNSRQVEFFAVKKYLDEYLLGFANKDMKNTSCEKLCVVIYNHMKVQYPTTTFISVYEDNENGSELFIN